MFLCGKSKNNQVVDCITSPRPLDRSNSNSAKRRHEVIESELQTEKRKNDSVFRMLLLGPGESGKSTVVKQLKIIHAAGFQHEDREQEKSVIACNMLASMAAMLDAVETFQIESDEDNEQIREDIHVMKKLQQRWQFGRQLDESEWAILKRLWHWDAVQFAYQRANEFQLNDSTRYFFDDIDRLSEAAFVPTDQDMIRARVSTLGVVQFTFRLRNCDLIVIDVGGQRSERRKWIHCFDNVNALIYVAAISEYNQVLFEASTVITKFASNIQNRTKMFHFL